jgi:two-component system heavy metal sensor histidine kinase CusS
MSLYARMTLGLAILTLLTLGGAFSVISVILDGYQERQLDTDLLHVARTEAIEAPANAFSFSSRPGHPASSDIGTLDRYGIIFDEHGNVIHSTRPFDAMVPHLNDFHAALDTPFDFAFREHRLRGVVVAIPGYQGRKLLIAASRDDLDGDSKFLRQAMAISLAVTLAWMVGATGWLVQRSMREHQRIAETLRRIASGEVDARVSENVSDVDLRRVGSDVDAIAGKLADLVEYQRRFITHAAHELRSPLAALHGELQQALRKERTAEEYRQSLLFASKASGRLGHLADELLELARAERTPRVAESVALDRVFGDVTESLRALASEKHITVECAKTPLHVSAFKSDVERIVSNLVDNAIRHSPEGGVVRVETEDGRDVRIRVRDEGPGVARADRQRIFEPFQRSPASRAEARGAGLGLAIARELARKHGGDIELEGEAGGSFVVSLPRATA